MAHNLLLGLLPEHERRRIANYCELVQLHQRATLQEADTPLKYAWFPHTAVCSTLVHADGGDAVEVGLVGREGMVGLPLILGARSNAFHVIVQVGGTATRIPWQAFVEVVLAPGHPFCGGLLHYVNMYVSNVAQTAACNRLHRIEQRLARWLLDLQDRVNSNVLPVTHEFLAMMVGAYRPSVTNALKVFEDRGILEVRRGALDVADLAALRAEACECHEAIRRRTDATLEHIRQMAA